MIKKLITWLTHSWSLINHKLIELKIDWIFIIPIFSSLLLSICSIEYRQVSLSSFTVFTSIYGIILNSRYAKAKEIFAKQLENKMKAYQQLVDTLDGLLRTISLKDKKKSDAALAEVTKAKQRLIVWASESSIKKLHAILARATDIKSDIDSAELWNEFYREIRKDIGYADSLTFKPYNFVLKGQKDCDEINES